MDLLLEGYRLQALGRRDDAERIYSRVLELEPRNVHALNLLGILCLESKRTDEAVRLIGQALSQTPDDPEALANLALALKDAGRLEEAAQSLKTAIRHDQRNPILHNNLGNILAAMGQDEEAIASFRAALQIDPSYADCLSNLASSMTKQGRLTGALAAASRAVELKPESPEAHNSLGEVTLKQARYEEAANSFRAALARRSDFFDAMANLSAALKEIGEVAEAEYLLRQVVTRDPGNALAHNSLGVLLEQQGDAARAAAQFRQAIEVAPKYGVPYYQLAQLKDSALTSDEIRRIQAFYDDVTTTDEQRAPLAFGLACIHERAREYDTSFAYLVTGQAIKAREGPYDDAKVVDHHARIKRAFPTVLETREAPPGSLPQPVFVLGMPRSGTTLTEQILASHPDVEGVGEVSLMEDTVSEMARFVGAPFPEGVGSLTDGQRRALGDYYLSRLRKRVGRAHYIVDKTPFNFQYVGFIATILPGARIIHCRRSPVDNCLSIFKLPFENAHSYAHDLESLGRYYSHYADLMSHWRQVVPVRMIDLQYEDLVTGLEAQSRRLLNFLGLPFDKAVMEFHTTQRLVKTPSASQVRRPIYNESIEAWRRYERQLAPLIHALAPALRPGGWAQGAP